MLGAVQRTAPSKIRCAVRRTARTNFC